MLTRLNSTSDSLTIKSIFLMFCYTSYCLFSLQNHSIVSKHIEISFKNRSKTQIVRCQLVKFYVFLSNRKLILWKLRRRESANAATTIWMLSIIFFDFLHLFLSLSMFIMQNISLNRTAEYEQTQNQKEQKNNNKIIIWSGFWMTSHNMSFSSTWNWPSPSSSRWNILSALLH